MLGENWRYTTYWPSLGSSPQWRKNNAWFCAKGTGTSCLPSPNSNSEDTVVENQTSSLPTPSSLPTWSSSSPFVRTAYLALRNTMLKIHSIRICTSQTTLSPYQPHKHPAVDFFPGKLLYREEPCADFTSSSGNLDIYLWNLFFWSSWQLKHSQDHGGHHGS